MWRRPLQELRAQQRSHWWGFQSGTWAGTWALWEPQSRRAWLWEGFQGMWHLPEGWADLGCMCVCVGGQWGMGLLGKASAQAAAWMSREPGIPEGTQTPRGGKARERPAGARWWQESGQEFRLGKWIEEYTRSLLGGSHAVPRHSLRNEKMLEEAFHPCLDCSVLTGVSVSSSSGHASIVVGELCFWSLLILHL